MNAVNEVIFEGTVSGYLEPRLANVRGSKVLEFSLEIPPIRPRDQSWSLNVTAWDGLAIANQHLAAGTSVKVTGSMFRDVWTNAHGEQRSRYKIQATGLEVMQDVPPATNNSNY